MKRIVHTLILILCVSVSAPTLAAWCRAQSPVAWGEGLGSTVDEACYIAIRNCVARTPAGYQCFVVDYSI